MPRDFANMSIHDWMQEGKLLHVIDDPTMACPLHLGMDACHLPSIVGTQYPQGRLGAILQAMTRLLTSLT